MILHNFYDVLCVCLLLPLLISGVENHQPPWAQVSAAAMLHARCERRCRELFEIDVKFGNSVAKEAKEVEKDEDETNQAEIQKRIETLPVAKYFQRKFLTCSNWY